MGFEAIICKMVKKTFFVKLCLLLLNSISDCVLLEIVKKKKKYEDETGTEMNSGVVF